MYSRVLILYYGALSVLHGSGSLLWGVDCVLQGGDSLFTGFALAADPSCASELEVRCLEILAARSDECLDDRVLGRLNVSYSTRRGGSGSSRCLHPCHRLNIAGGSA